MSQVHNQIDTIDQLLKEGSDLKLLYEKTEEALEILRKAKLIVDQSTPPLSVPWPQLVNYRLAHVLMRGASDESELEEIDELLADAIKAKCLGPLPRLYRLAVMHRLKCPLNQLQSVFKPLIEEIAYYNEEDGDQDRCNSEEHERHDRLTALQNNFFNMLELAAYFTGYPYNGFEGKGRIHEPKSEITLRSLNVRHSRLKDREPYSDLLCKFKSWNLYGTVTGLATVDYPGDFVLEELEERMKNNDIKPPCIVFRISSNRTIHDWNFNLQKKDNQFKWEKVNRGANHLLFLASIYKLKGKKRGSLLWHIFGSDTLGDDAIYRKWKQRCTEAIVSKFNELNYTDLNIKKNNLFLSNAENTDPIPKFRNEISVLGAMESTLFQDQL